MEHSSLQHVVHKDLDGALMSKFDGIGQDIHEHLSQFPLVLDEALWHVLSNDHLKCESLVFCHGIEDAFHLFKEVFQHDDAIHESKFSRLQLLKFLLINYWINIPYKHILDLILQ
jgi:hypothetical protein